MKTVLTVLALIAAPVTAPVAAYATPHVEPALGNTVVSTYEDGRHGYLYLKAGGLYDYIGRKKDASSGKWILKGEQICLRQSKPIPVPMTFCTGFPSEGGIGTSWRSKAISGDPVTLQVVKGIVR
jgi:hypothetical protein